MRYRDLNQNTPQWSSAIHELLSGKESKEANQEERDSSAPTDRVDLIQTMQEVIKLVHRTDMFDSDFLQASEFYPPADRVMQKDAHITIDDLNHLINLVGAELFVTAFKVSLSYQVANLNNQAAGHINEFKKDVLRLEETVNLLKGI